MFMVDFEMEQPFVVPLHELDSEKIKYSMDDGFLEYRNYNSSEISEQEAGSFRSEKKPISIRLPLSFSKYEKAFEIVKNNLNYGNSFLTNLTAETPIELRTSLEQIFLKSKAKYKLYVADKFVCYSPETFVQISENGKISSFPMKGTIDAIIADAEQVILKDDKEKYEHTTIVDLIRNDLSKVCKKVWVERFRYLEKIQKEDGRELLQVSSEVCGSLAPNWQDSIGSILFDLLPAGSISGAPKEKTISIIQAAEKLTYETAKRGYYTGVFGVFDGKCLNTAVMIRFIEKRAEKYYFKSGGGITTKSDARKEYDEMNQKIYLPIR